MSNPISNTADSGAPMMAVDGAPNNVTAETLLRASTSWNGVPYQAYPAGVPEISALKISIPAK